METTLSPTKSTAPSPFADFLNYLAVEKGLAQNTLAAYRIFWHYGPDARVITILAITSHP